MEQFWTIAQHAESLFKDKGSKHLGFSFSVNSAADAKQFVDELRKQHSKANHVCYAYRIVSNNEIIEYCTDDGEPNNSAGAPILGQIKSAEVLNVLVIVVRYFGGTKLGVSGLINAYKTTAQQALIASKKKLYTQSYSVTLKPTHAQLGETLSFLSKENFNIVDQTYEGEHRITVQTTADGLKQIKTKFEAELDFLWESTS